MKKYLNFFYKFLLITLFLLCSLSCKIERDFIYHLDTNWEISTVSFNGPYEPLDANKLSNISKFVPNKCGYVWIRNNFKVPEELEKESLAFYFGTIQTAGQIYLNRKYLGKSGSFPPFEYSNGLKSTTINIPGNYINKNNENNELIIQIWVDGPGQLQTIPFLSTVDQVNISENWHNTLFSKIFFLFTMFMFLVFVIYIILYRLRQKEKYYGSFAHMNLFTAFFLISLCFVEFPLILYLKIPLLILQKITQGCCSQLTAYFAVSFIRDFLNEKDSKSRTIYRVVITILPCIAILTTKSLHQFYTYLTFSYILLAIHICYGVRLVIKSIIKHNEKVKTLLMGFTPILIGLIVVLINQFLPRPYVSIMIIALFWQFTIFAFICILISDFAKMCSKVEFLNKNLENIVKERTYELKKSNKQLEETNEFLESEQKKSKKEIELAKVIQENFYIQNIPVFDEWEISFYFKPLEGISGDLYDIYYAGETLDGIGIFDVSGHGMASGLVTMLVKNIIYDEFYKGLGSDLTNVVSQINTKVIQQKGNIENYLTGILCRIRENKLEIVNAGHPRPLFYNAETEEVNFLDLNDENSIGVIGIPDLQTDYKLLKKEFHKNDTILLYTDGILENENKEKKPFGKANLQESFKKSKNKNIDKILDSIVSDFTDYLDGAPLTDDITLFILRKL